MVGYRERVQSVQNEVVEACHRVGRDPREVHLIGVSKTVGPEALPDLATAGIVDLGENRWQHARDMLSTLAAANFTWHFIGHLQANKVKDVIGRFSWIHSVDSVALATEMSRRCIQQDKWVQLLLQVNIAGETQKFGLSPEKLIEVAQRVHELPGVTLRGLMTIAPKSSDVNEVRPVFRELADWLRRLQQSLGDPQLTELSMGMSDDFPVAVEEGATMIRIGRRLMAGTESNESR
ncbi:YggS family pyridoxal phosphate-dependent enzyme [Alicyclobacillaceae bacterium I2511]|nr:YggS family pyridoxal phosphate-dependent enzyme [Alicyclobacillaceae bacterium I2511]